MAPRAGFEPATNRLTVDCSTAELSRNSKVGQNLMGLACFVNCQIDLFTRPASHKAMQGTPSSTSLKVAAPPEARRA
jgi:hypothetical protein